MINSKTKHRRNHSQHPAPQPKKTSKTKISSKKKTNKGLNSQLVHQLLRQSNNKPIQKQVFIDDLQEQIRQEEQDDQFFQFGRKTRNFQTVRPQMEEIIEVPDTGSYSQRNTQTKVDNADRTGKNDRTDRAGKDDRTGKDDRANNKQNVKDFGNQKRQDFRYSRLNMDNIEHLKTKQAQSHRILHNCSKRSTSKSNRSHDCSQSTVELKGRKSRAKSREKGRSRGTRALEKQVQMLWECIGDIWVRNRAMQKRVEKHDHCIEELARRSQMYAQELISLKLECKSQRSRL